MAGWLKEPLLHFLVAGVLLFALHAWLNGGVTAFGWDSSRTVRVTGAEVAWLMEAWARQYQRPPEAAELKGLVSDYIKEEMLCREARALGLDQGDTIVRRRLAQKMEFLIQDTSRLPDPSDEDLRRFYDAHAQEFATAGLVSFEQIFFNPDKGEPAPRAAEALVLLSGAADPSTLGDQSLLEREFRAEDETSLGSLFGAEFARAVFALEPGQWAGPVESGYGQHLVRVTEKQMGQPRDFAEVRDRVLDEWRREREQQEHEAYLSGLRSKYNVVVDEAVTDLLGPVQEPGR